MLLLPAITGITIAISQMEILTQDHRIEALEAHSEDLSPVE